MSLSQKEALENERITPESYRELALKYKSLDTNRKSYVEESQKKIRLQTTLIKRLRTENNSLHDRISKATELVDNKESRTLKRKLSELDGQKSSIEKHLQDEQQRLEALKAERRKLTKEKDDLRRARAKIRQGQPRPDFYRHQIQRLENRLEQALKKFNTATTENARLREEIMSIRTDRVIADKAARKVALDNELAQQRIEHLMASSAQEHERRESAQKSLAELKQIADREEKEFEDEYRDLGRIAEEHRRAQQEREAQMLPADAENPSEVAESSIFDELTDRDGTSESADQSGLGGPRTISDAEFLALFRQLGEQTGLPCSAPHELEQLVDHFIRLEDNNFSLFNYSNELQTEIETHEETLSRLRKELQRVDATKEEADARLRERLELLSEKLAAFQKESEDLEEKLHAADELMDAVLDRVWRLYGDLDCSALPLIATGDSQPVSPDTLMNFLGAIEERVSGIVSYIASLRRRGGVSDGVAQQLFIPREELDPAIQALAEGTSTLTPAAAQLLQTFASGSAQFMRIGAPSSAASFRGSSFNSRAGTPESSLGIE
eukprot:gnl/Chilomastix_cuspidata/1820.p1 GENE.gnl/Chilomastix_cuspidata/1820~~gnl/Chilomastix_cuspidata/1820.p1  ORF type:complete len:555 (-),score=211.05 gnl/Chilomastix_cuspidata/1820:8-1672(-)